MAAQQQSETRWGGLVYLGLESAGKPVYTILAKTQIVEIAGPHNVEWGESPNGCVCGVCHYGQEIIPVVDLGHYFKETSTVTPQDNASVKQLIVIRTTRIHHSRSQKLGLCSSQSVQMMRLTVEQQKTLVDGPESLPELLTNAQIVRGVFTLPKRHIALFNFDRIAEDANTVMMAPEMVATASLG